MAICTFVAQRFNFVVAFLWILKRGSSEIYRWVKVRTVSLESSFKGLGIKVLQRVINIKRFSVIMHSSTYNFVWTM